MNAMTTTALDTATIERLGDRIEVDHDKVTAALAADFANRLLEDFNPDDAIGTAIDEAIDDIDEDTYGVVLDHLRDRVAAEIEFQAKAIALRLMRELAEHARQLVAVEVK